MIQLDAINTVSIFGPVSSGKSYLICQFMANMERVLHLDTTMENDDPDWSHVWQNPQQLAQIILSEPAQHKIAYHPNSMHVAFEWCASIYWKLDLARWLVLDECHEYADHPYFSTLMRYARKRKMGVMCASQRIADVPKSLTSASRTIILFYTHEYRDHVAIKDRLGIEVSEAVKALRPCIYDDEREQVIQIPEILVYRRGRGVQIHDMKTGGVRSLIDNPHDETEETDEAEAEQIPAPGREENSEVQPLDSEHSEPNEVPSS